MITLWMFGVNNKMGDDMFANRDLGIECMIFDTGI